MDEQARQRGRGRRSPSGAGDTPPGRERRVAALRRRFLRLALVLLLFLIPASLQAGGVSGKVNCRGFADHGNAVIYAQKVPGETASAPRNPVLLDQINLTFVPHVLPVVAGTTVSFPNSDQVRHNVFSPSSAKRFNLGTYPRGVARQVTFDKPGEVALLCNVHAEMSAYVLVLETRYFVVSAKDGSYSLNHLPPGKYTVTAWHERFKPVSLPVEIQGTETVPMHFNLTSRR